jgi:hypothetical protein
MRPVLAALVMLMPKVKPVWLIATPTQPNPAMGRRSLGVSLVPGSRSRSRHNISSPPTVKRIATSRSGGMNSAAYLVAAKFKPQKTAARIREISVSNAALSFSPLTAPASLPSPR